mgnify:CR=1 FL=1
MRLFSNEHVFPRPWSTITAASWCKYPNKEWAPHITHVDYLSRDLVDGQLVTERILTYQQSIPPTLLRLVGLQEAPSTLVYERSVVDAANEDMRLDTCNLTFGNLMVIEETCRYQPDPADRNTTLFTQTCRIKSFHGWSWLTRYIEDFCVGRFEANAQRGKRALEEAVEALEKAWEVVCEGKRGA